jgi:hypothetical protein
VLAVALGLLEPIRLRGLVRRHLSKTPRWVTACPCGL